MKQPTTDDWYILAHDGKRYRAIDGIDRGRPVWSAKQVGIVWRELQKGAKDKRLFDVRKRYPNLKITARRVKR